jgi:Reverse transcriptase (RNA-dependent DNA polymerase)/Endonuclease-reverse transcriptase
MAVHNSGKLQVMTWNANSISPKKHEFFDFLLSGSVDIALLNETYLKQGISFSHPDYRCYRLDRADRPKGGVAVLVRQDLPHTLVPSFKTKTLECIGISVASASGPIEFISAYRPGGRSTPEDISKFRDDILQLTSSRSSFFICGDFNARHSSWNCSRANQAGKALFECGGPFAVQYPPTHTRIPLGRSQNPSTLDIILTNGLHDVENICTRTALSSDHLPVIFEVVTDVRREVPSHFVFDYKNANWTHFRQCLDSRLNLDFSLDRIERESDVDSMIQDFTEAILEARSLSVPLVRPNRHSLTLTPELKFIISRKNAIRRIAQNTFNTAQIREYEIQNRLVRDACDALGNKSFGDKLATLRPGHKSFWNFTKIIKNKCRSIPALKVDGVTLITEQEKAEAIADKFSMAHENTSQSPLNASVVDSCSVLHVNEFNVDPSALTSPREVKKIIKKLKNGKAPGFDGVPNILLKNLPRRAVVYLTYVFNSCIKLCYFPKVWKHASVIPIPKPGKDHSNPSNYRPISLLSSISKVFEKIILKRLQDFISANNILPDHQFGFRMAHSTSHQLRRVVRHVKGRREPPLSESTGMLLLDVEKAFDSVWHEALLHKLLTRGCNISLARLIFSFLKERSFQVCVGKAQSSSCNIPYGVPQGAILSPTLYNIFTSDIPNAGECELATFADDTAIFVSDKLPEVVCGKLQSQLDSLSDYFKDWKIRINPTKTQAIFFTRRFWPKNAPGIELET